VSRKIKSLWVLHSRVLNSSIFSGGIGLGILACGVRSGCGGRERRVFGGTYKLTARWSELRYILRIVCEWN
jgi:hypothetical protein